MKTSFCISTILLVFALPALQADLPRRAFIGTQLLEVCDSTAQAHGLPRAKGVLVQQVIEGSSAESIGVFSGDIILSVNDLQAKSVASFVHDVGSLQAGDEIRLQVFRAGQAMELTGRASGFPEETSPHALVIYDQVPFEDGYVRTIIHTPDTLGTYPAFFFIPGYLCYSLDNLSATHPYYRLLDGISEKGYAVIKKEKPGMGDSRSSRDCHEIGLFDEADVFAASFNALKKYDFIDHDNVFVFGHSMGGVQAPLMDTRYDPKGIMVYGTAVRPWFEYFIEQTRIQRLLLGQDYLLNEARHEQSIRFYYRFLIEKESPEALMKDPEMAEFLNSAWRYEEGGFMNGRHYTFWQDLQDTRLFSAWSQTRSHVLSLHGKGEYVAFNPYEHQLIADIVNHYNPGKAIFMRIPDIDHAFTYVKDLEHSIAVRNDREYQLNNFHPGIADILHDWMEALMEE